MNFTQHCVNCMALKQKSCCLIIQKQTTEELLFPQYFYPSWLREFKQVVKVKLFANVLGQGLRLQSPVCTSEVAEKLFHSSALQPMPTCRKGRVCLVPKSPITDTLKSLLIITDGSLTPIPAIYYFTCTPELQSCLLFSHL